MGSQCSLETDTERKSFVERCLREEMAREEAPKISATRERPPRLVGFWISEARRRMSCVSELGFEGVLVGRGRSVVQVPDLVCKGVVVVGEEPVTSFCTVRVYSTGEGVGWWVTRSSLVVPSGMKYLFSSPRAGSMARKSALVIRSIKSPPRRYDPWKMPRRV